MLSWLKKHPKVISAFTISLFSAFGIWVYEAKPAYDGYISRLQLSGCVAEGSGAKYAYADYFIEHKGPPSSIGDLQLPPKSDSKFLDEIVVRKNGFDLRCAESAQSVTVRFTYREDESGNVIWSCDLPEGAESVKWAGCN